MVKISLVPPHKSYAEELSAQSSTPLIRDTLGLTREQSSVEGTRDFIAFVLEEERKGNQYSRVIVNEKDKPVGVITLKDIVQSTKSCEIGTWIGADYWGMGYNQLAKTEILHRAFTQLNLNVVFAGSKRSNIRSQKAQEKLPYVRIDVQKQFPDQHKKLEMQAKEPCVLNVIEKEQFLNWYEKNHT